MSKYTTEVRFICESYAGLDVSGTYTDINTIIEKSRGKIFDFNFPIFDESYRSVLETKILKHFYTREIGLETVGLWKLKLDTKMNEVMPYYNELYKTTLFEYNPLYDVDYKREHSGQDIGNEHRTGQITESGTTSLTGNTKGKTTKINDDSTSDNVDESGGKTGKNDTSTNGLIKGTGDNWRYFSNTPQGGIDNVKDLDYLTDLTNTTDKTQSDSEETELVDYNEDYTKLVTKTNTFKGNETGTSEENKSESTESESGRDTEDTMMYNNTDEYTEHVFGKMSGVSYTKLITDFRESLINIDMMIIDELSELFMNLW